MDTTGKIKDRSEEPPHWSATRDNAEETAASDEPPQRSHTRRAPLWADVPDAQWNDWRWQLSHRLNSYDELSQIIHLTEEEAEGCRNHHFRVDITP
jgi:lysine 2,3-aminomutase